MPARCNRLVIQNGTGWNGGQCGEGLIARKKQHNIYTFLEFTEKIYLLALLSREMLIE